MSPSITHVLFDLDGTLLDSEALYTEATQVVCDRYGARFGIELKRKIMGGDSREGAITVIEALGLPLTPEQYLIDREVELNRLIPGIRCMPGAEDLIARLRSAEVPCCIATSGHRPVTDLKLAQHAFLRSLGPVVCGDDARMTRGKPAPDIFLLAARELGVAPERCAVVEDTVNGVRAGVAAGMRTIAVIDPRFGFAPEHFPGAAATVSSLSELSLETLGVR
ncbi:MAG TPA: HAD-IA family hydrolase [Polyangiales bacterium]